MSLLEKFEVGDEVMVLSEIAAHAPIPGLVSFVSIELKTMSILVGRGCRRSEDTNVVITEPEVPTKVKIGWSGPERKVAQESLKPRECSWYDHK